MPIFTLGGAMFIGMGAGLAGNAALDSTVYVQNTCDQIDKAQENLKEITDSYKKLLANEQLAQHEIDDYIINVGAHKHNTEVVTQNLKDSFRQEELRRDISLAIFLFVLILFLLFKKFNIFGNIWNLIVKK